MINSNLIDKLFIYIYNKKVKKRVQILQLGEKMEFIKTIIKNKKLIIQLGKNDFKNKFASTSLGSIWGFLSQFIFIITYVIVFQYILKTGNTGNDPYVVWFLPGMSMWLFLHDAIMSASSSIKNYSYLVKKVVFPVDIIPIFSIISNSFISGFLFIVSTIICMLFKYMPNLLMFIYVIFAAICLVIAITRFTSAITTLIPDFEQALGIIMQLCFWFTPIVWNLNMLDSKPLLQKIMQCMPFTYLVTGFREVFINGNIITKGHGIYTIIFWTVTIAMFVWGNYIFKKNKKDFADVL